MARDRQLHRQLRRLAELQSLQAAASTARCAAAIAEARQAEARLRQCRKDAAREAGRLGALPQAGALDFDAWRIGRAALDHLDALEVAAEQDAASRREEEAATRESWARDCRLRDLTSERVQHLARKLADRRDEKAASEAVALRRTAAGAAE